MANNKELRCAICKKKVEDTTLFKVKHKEGIFYFCSQEHKTKFELKHGIPDGI